MRPVSLLAALLGALTAACGSRVPAPEVQDAGAGSTGESPDSGTIVASRMDAGPQMDAGPAPAECAGLAPQAVGRPSAAVDLTGHWADQWWSGGTDSSGAVSLIRTNDNEEPPFILQVSDPLGVERGVYQAPNTSFAEMVFAQRDGFVVSGFDASPRSGYLVALDREGAVVATVQPSEYGLRASDPRGGIMILSGSPDGAPSTVAAYDERLNVRFRTSLPSDERAIAFGVDGQGNSLVFLDAADRYGSGKIGGMWIDPSGNAGPEFEAQGIVGPFLHLVPRIMSGFFVRQDLLPPAAATANLWIRQFDPLGEGAPAPDWLVSRPGATVQVVRGGHAYAVIAPRRPDVCDAKIEIVAPSGASCGTAVFPTDQAFCRPGLGIGRDGTVIEAGVVEPPPGGAVRTSRFRWWTGYLE